MGLLSRALSLVEIPVPLEAGEKKGKPRIPPDAEQKIKRKINRFYKTYASLQGIVLDLPEKIAEKSKTTFNRKVSGMVSSFGTAVKLPSHRSLVLFPKPLDRELLAHRLSANLNTVSLCAFEAENPGQAMGEVRTYL